MRCRNRRPEDGLAVPLRCRKCSHLTSSRWIAISRPAAATWCARESSSTPLAAGLPTGCGRAIPAIRAPRRGYNQLNRIPADQVLHIFEPLEGGQLRGVPRLSPVLLRLKSLDNYDDAVLFRQGSLQPVRQVHHQASTGRAPTFDPSTGLAPAGSRRDTDGRPGSRESAGIAGREEVVFSEPAGRR